MNSHALLRKNQEIKDPLSNVIIKSRRNFQTVAGKLVENLNYGGLPKISQNIEVELLTSISMLEECHDLYLKKLQRKHQLYNFFLDDSDGQDDPHQIQLVHSRLTAKKKVQGYSLRNSWTKGGKKGFFRFIKQGEMLLISDVKNGWAQINFEEGTGLFRLKDIRLIGDFQ